MPSASDACSRLPFTNSVCASVNILLPVILEPSGAEQAYHEILKGRGKLENLGLLLVLNGFLAIYRQVSSNFPVRGNLVRDAHLAALLLQHGVRKIYTADSDFKKFEFSEVSNPFS